MSIPIQIPGLNEYIQEIPEGNIILFQGGINPISSIFVKTLAFSAYKEGRKINYITSKTEEEVEEQLDFFLKGDVSFTIAAERSHRHWGEYVEEDTVTIFDSFSYLVLDHPLAEVRRILEELLRLCKQKNATIFLTTEQGMLDEKVDTTVCHLVDCIVLFLSRDTEKGVRRYMRIPKWVFGQSFEDNIYYPFDGKHILIDLRSRVG